jgi:UDP-2-acetamido-3-amino-2,3-dideoxy-glucuronate N-acetyltransferase
VNTMLGPQNTSSSMVTASYTETLFWIFTRANVVRKDEYRRTLVQAGATIGANATIVCGVTIGRYAFIAAGAVVKRDVPPFALMAGVPARQVGWMSRHGERLPLGVAATGRAACPHSGDVYTVRDGACTLEPTPAAI